MLIRSAGTGKFGDAYATTTLLREATMQEKGVGDIKDFEPCFHKGKMKEEL